MTKPTALIIDDEPDIRELLDITLRRMDITVVPAATLDEALTLLGTRRFDLCLTDMRLPDGDGHQVLDWIQKHAPDLPVAVITAHGNVESAVQALKAGAFDFVSKPVDLADLRKLVDAALRVSDAATPARSAPTLLGGSDAIQRVRELVAKVARSQAPVHIAGESGTGKELVARLIHQGGPRRDAPFVAVNCGAIPGELMESEFFGHRRGAFTGAVADKGGLFQAADGGTLFLDEIADLPLHMQVKLLRVIQERAVRPVGAQGEVPVDVRILSATHGDLSALVSRGAFREDLYYRINVIEVAVPPLRERPEDISCLADHILRKLSQRGGADPGLTPGALARLRGYAFPGNVRELENILERALTLASGDAIDADDIVLRGGNGAERPAPGALEAEVEELQRERIERALESTRWNKTAAAKALGMTLRQLRYRLKKLGLD